MSAVVQLEGVSKRFGPVEVLSDVSIALQQGHVHALAGANGAGKSTLVKLLAGVFQPGRGRLLIDGVETRLAGTADAKRQGIAVIHQHPALFPDMTVAENIFAGWQPRRFGQISWKEMRKRAKALLSRLGMPLDVDAQLRTLGVGARQSVAIAAALSSRVRVLVMDEPTSAISAHELDQFFAVVERLRTEGVAILFITHFLDEIFAISDTVTVLRSGRHVATVPVKDLTPNSVISLMIGAPPSALFPKAKAAIGEPVLRVEGLRGNECVEDVSFVLNCGAIVGLFGLVGSGRSEVAETIFGMRKPLAGTIYVDGHPVELGKPSDAMRLGIALVPEDRHLQGLVLPFTNRANETLPILDRLFGALGWIRSDQEVALADTLSTQLGVVATGVEQITGTLSGGNQQKVLLAKWLALRPRILILDQPTRGVDVSAKADIYRIISDLALAGMAILLIGDDPDEVIGMSDRILVFREGRIVAEVDRSDFDRERILLAAAHLPADETIERELA